MKFTEYSILIFGMIAGLIQITLGMISLNYKEILYLTMSGFTSIIISYSAFGFYHLYKKIK